MADPIPVVLGHRWRSAKVDEEYVAIKGCGVSNGIWYCVTHDEPFRTGMVKDSHITKQTKPCTLAWICFEHGAEVP